VYTRGINWLKLRHLLFWINGNEYGGMDITVLNCKWHLWTDIESVIWVKHSTGGQAKFTYSEI